MLAPPDYSALRAFLAVAEALSFSRAAETLGVSASALSQMVRGLEDRVGAQLLHRTTRRVALTEAGRALHDRTHPMLKDLTDAFAAVRRSGGRTAGIVRVHAFRLGAELFLAPLLAAFTAAHPDIVLDIAYDDTVVDLPADSFDVGIRLGEVVARDMIAVRLGPDLRQVAISPRRLILPSTVVPRRPMTCSTTHVSAGGGRGTARPTNGSSTTLAAPSKSPFGAR